MSVITKVLKQKAIYWAPMPEDCYDESALYDNFGRVKLVPVTPVELEVRWEDVRTEVVTPDGTTLTSSSKVMVSEDVAPGGYLKLGTLEDVVDFDNPLSSTSVFEIIKFDKIPNFKNTEFLRIAYL